MQKLLSIAVKIILVFVFCETAFAYDKDGYPYNKTSGCVAVCTQDNLSFCQNNCTSYAGYKLNKIAPIGFSNSYGGASWGNGGHWSTAAGSAHIPKSSKPLPGDIAYWNVSTAMPYGHVAFVEKVNYDGDGKATSIDITEYNYGTACNFGQRLSLSASNPDGYIHFLDHTYAGVACAPHSNGKQLCWSYNSNISCSSGESHFYNDKNDKVCYLASSSDCTGVVGSSNYAGGRGGGVIGILKGPGFETVPTDSKTPGLPNFIGKKIELSNYNPKRTDSIQIYGYSKNTGSDDVGSDDEIEGRYFLSEGHKKDSSSDWIKIGSDITHGSSLDPGESHREDKAFRLWEYSIIQPGGVYNVVYCIDRTRNEDNDGGEYEEEHESDNCTSEAVFTVQAEAPPPPSTDKFVWSSAGAVANRTCTQIAEPADPDTWGDNFFCADSNYGIAWSSNGPISNMRCTQIIESADPHSWNDNYLCIPNTSNIYFSWSSAGPIDSQACVQWLEAADPYTWKDNFLCYQIQEVIPPPPPPTYNLSVNNISLNISGRDKLWEDGFFDLGITVVNTGNNLSGSVTVGYYLNESLISTHTISASDLANGAYRSDALADIPSPLTPGNHTAKICVDPNNVIAETDETDNCHSIKVEVEKHVSPAAMLLLFQ